MEEVNGTSESVSDQPQERAGGRSSRPAPAKRTAKAPSKAPAKRTAKAPAKRVRQRAGTRTRPGATGLSWAPPDGPEGPADRPWRRYRNRALYNRRVQRADEHWHPATRLGASLLSRPELVLGALGANGPVEVDGRVLNRGSQALLELARRFQGASDEGPADPVALRRQLTRLAGLAMPVRTDVHAFGRVIRAAGSSGGIPVRIYRQFGTGIGTSRPPAIVYFHGGGWVTGDLDSHDPSCRLLAAASGCIVVAVAYRLAPEDPFPAAVDDALEASAWVQRNSDEVGHAEGQVGVMGDSAGGNLAAVVAMEARSGKVGGASGVPAPVAQGLIYPALDARLNSDSARSMADGFLLTTAAMEYFRSCYVPDRSLWDSAMVSPLLADDHRDLAPALVVTAGFDPLRDDGTGYAGLLEKAGVEVEYHCYDDQVHGFMAMGVLPDSLALATEVYDAMGRLMRRSATPA